MKFVWIISTANTERFILLSEGTVHLKMKNGHNLLALKSYKPEQKNLIPIEE